MGRHELRPERSANLTKVVGLAGMAAAAATVAMTVGTGTAQAAPGDGLRSLFSGGGSTSGNSTPKKQSTTPTSVHITNGIKIGSIYNSGPVNIGVVKSPQPGFVVKPPDPANGKPFTQVTGFQLPIWNVDSTGKAKPLPF